MPERRLHQPREYSLLPAHQQQQHIHHQSGLIQMHAVMPIQIATKMSAVMEQTSKMHSTISLHNNVSTKCTSIRRPVPPFAQATIAPMRLAWYYKWHPWSYRLLLFGARCNSRKHDSFPIYARYQASFNRTEELKNFQTFYLLLLRLSIRATSYLSTIILIRLVTFEREMCIWSENALQIQKKPIPEIRVTFTIPYSSILYHVERDAILHTFQTRLHKYTHVEP